MLKPLLYSVFSKHACFKPTPKIGTLFVSTPALTEEKPKQNNKNGNKTTRFKQENHLVLLQKESRQHRHKAIQLHCLDRKQTTKTRKKQT